MTALNKAFIKAFAPQAPGAGRPPGPAGQPQTPGSAEPTRPAAAYVPQPTIVAAAPLGSPAPIIASAPLAEVDHTHVSFAGQQAFAMPQRPADSPAQPLTPDAAARLASRYLVGHAASGLPAPHIRLDRPPTAGQGDSAPVGPQGSAATARRQASTKARRKPTRRIDAAHSPTPARPTRTPGKTATATPKSRSAQAAKAAKSGRSHESKARTKSSKTASPVLDLAPNRRGAVATEQRRAGSRKPRATGPAQRAAVATSAPLARRAGASRGTVPVGKGLKRASSTVEPRAAAAKPVQRTSAEKPRAPRDAKPRPAQPTTTSVPQAPAPETRPRPIVYSPAPAARTPLRRAARRSKPPISRRPGGDVAAGRRRLFTAMLHELDPFERLWDDASFAPTALPVMSAAPPRMATIEVASLDSAGEVIVVDSTMVTPSQSPLTPPQASEPLASPSPSFPSHGPAAHASPTFAGHSSAGPSSTGPSSAAEIVAGQSPVAAPFSVVSPDAGDTAFVAAGGEPETFVAALAGYFLDGDLDREINIDLAPLSAFSPVVAVDDDFRPRLEVEEFGWPMAVEMLLARARQAVETFARRLLGEAIAGEKVLAICGAARGQGCSTLTLTLARQVAALGGRVVLVDADRAKPDLARTLGVDASLGWDQSLTGEISLDESLIASNFDRVSLAPWRDGAADMPFDELRTGVALEMLRDHYDLVLIDAGPIAGPAAPADSTAAAELAAVARIDGCYLVGDGRSLGPARLSEAVAAAHGVGWRVLGIVENYSPLAQDAALRGAA